MNRLSLVGVVALATLMLPAISCESGSMDLLAQKLEDHFNGKDLENAITFAECQAALDDYLSWDEAALDSKVMSPGPLRQAIAYLGDFLRNSLEYNSMNGARLSANADKAKDFIGNLESTYKKFRPVYGFQTSLKESAIGRSTLALVGMLSQKELPDRKVVRTTLINWAWKEMDKNIKEWLEYLTKEDLFKKSDMFLELSKYVFAPETFAVVHGVAPLKTEESMERLSSGDKSVFKQWQDVYQAQVAKLKDMALPQVVVASN